jgi:hypothetical protein
MKKILLLILIAVIGAGIYALYLYNKPVSDINDLKPEFTLEANTFFNDFISDEAKANTKYLGKIVEVKGVVRDLITDGQGATVILETSDPIFGINCGLSEGQEMEFDKFKTGDKVTIRGECAGYDMDVVLTRCVLIQ